MTLPSHTPLFVSLSGSVRVNAISPGRIGSGDTVYAGSNAVQQLAGRVENPKYVPDMILFLCPDQKELLQIQKFNRKVRRWHKMKQIDLKIIVDALEEVFEGWAQFLNKETGEVESIPEDREHYEGDDYEADLEKFDDSYIYELLPDQYQINEYEIMKDFARRSDISALLTALNQKHPYRKFKDKINALDIDDLYFAFRENAYYDIAKEWCNRHGISYCDSRKKKSSEVKDNIMSNKRLKCGIIADSIMPGRYRHYKGNEYKVLCMAKHSETEEWMVVYKALYGEGLTWVRPASMWYEPVTTKDGNRITRFTYIGD